MSNKNAKSTEPSPRCYHCGKACTEDDYCYGCKQHICEACSPNVSLMGAHEPEAHLQDPEEEE